MDRQFLEGRAYNFSKKEKGVDSMKFQLFFIIIEDNFKRELVGEMTFQEIKEFAAFMELGETVEGYSFDELKFSLEEKAFHLYVNC